ncbi:MAG: hypothetical protein LBJ20_03620 [Candidatus Methanoplasma sp.]|nr:hypothetical protein [Candidatus Methanoplasma sp.]
MEPYIDVNGEVGVLAVILGQVEYFPIRDWYTPGKFDKEELAVLESIGLDYRWPLPLKLNSSSLPPDLPDLHRRLCHYFQKYVWFGDENAYDLIANWIISTYFRDQFRTSPILIFDGVTIAGKSTAMAALEQVVYRGELMTSGSGPAIAREITDYNTTILLDEALDGLNSDRGADIYTMIKSCFDRKGMWIRADPKGRKNYKYKTYTSMAISIKGDTLPTDVYNRGIRINMTSVPEGTELADIMNCDEDDDVLDPISPLRLRTELYALKTYTAAWKDSGSFGGDPRIVNFKAKAEETRDHFTVRLDNGQWKYAFLLGMDGNAPQIRDRNRKIASTLYSIGLATNSEREVIEMIIKQDEANREIAADTPEALTFSSLLEIVEETWKQEGVLHKNMTMGLFYSILDGITTTQVARRYNLILTEQGNATKDPVLTNKVTANLNALGLVYRRGTSNKSYMNPRDPAFVANWMRCLSRYAPRHLAKYTALVEDGQYLKR